MRACLLSFSFITRNFAISFEWNSNDHGHSIMAMQQRQKTLLKMRDIARAHELHEGSIIALAKRFHASTTTVSKAIRQPAAAWQAAIDKAKRGEPRPWEYAAATLEPIHVGPGDRIVAFVMQVEGQAAMARVDGPSIVPAANMLGRDGWEIAHVTTEGERVRFLLKRPQFDINWRATRQ